MHNYDVKKQLDQALELYRKGMKSLADVKLSELYRKHPDDEFANYGMAFRSELRGDHQNAVVYFKKAVSIDPAYIEAWYNLAIVYRNMKDSGNMIRTYQKIVEIGDTRNPMVNESIRFIKELTAQVLNGCSISLMEYLQANDLFEEGFAEMDNAQWEDALKCFQQSASINAFSEQTFGNIGICLAKTGRIKEALEAFERALKLKPGYKPVVNNMKKVKELNEGEKLDGSFEAMDYFKGRRKIANSKS